MNELSVHHENGHAQSVCHLIIGISLRILLGFITFLIVYGSLYPFNIDLASYSQSSINALLSFRFDDTSRGDLVANVLLFVPFGFVAMQVLRDRAPLIRWGLILTSGFALAWGIQAVQLVLPERVPAGSDALWNLLGCAAGGFAGLLPFKKYFPEFPVRHYPAIPFLLALLWIAYQWAPFVPSLDWQLLKNNIKAVFLNPTLNIVWTLQGIVVWFIVFRFLRESQSRLATGSNLPLLVLCVLVTSFFFVGHAVSTDRVAGALIALLLWPLFKNVIGPGVLACLLIVVLLGISYTPFQLREAAGTFNWVPFSGALDGNMLINVLATFKKIFLYGSLIWLMVEARIRLRLAAGIAALLLFAAEVPQIYFAEATPEITDALLAVLVGIAFHYYGQAEQHAGKRYKEKVSNAEDKLNALPGEAAKARIQRSTAVKEIEASQINVVSSSPLKLQLNLHNYQKFFLDETAKRSKKSISEICSLIIDAAVEEDGAEARLNDQLSPVVLDKKRLSRRRWTAVTIHLEAHRRDILAELADSLEYTPSRILRLLIENHLSSVMKNAKWYQALRFRPPKLTRLRRNQKELLTVATVFVLVVGYFVINYGRKLTVDTPRWAGYPATIILDPHVHTKFSDGALSPEEVVELAVNNGCNALAITDHSDVADSASSAQLDRIQRIRIKYPNLLLFTGIEINIPQYRGREHMGVIVSPENEQAVLRQLGDIAEDAVLDEGRSHIDDTNLIQNLIKYQQLDEPIITIYNHPSRKVPKVSQSVDDILRWIQAGHQVTAIEGAPGHQTSKAIGSYKALVRTINRWDPMVAEIGGGWDQLLAQGHNIWAALAPSDYHNRHLDKSPCEFSRTHLAVPEASYKGVLQAIESGTFWADHGRILEQFYFSVEYEERVAPAYPGSTVHIGHTDSVAVFSIAIQRGPGSLNMPLSAELISNCVDGKPAQIAKLEFSPGESVVSGLFPIASVGLDERSCFVRARIRLSNFTEPDFLAYSNPIRFVL